MSNAKASEAMVRLDGVTKRFGAVTALHEAWLKAAPGEFLTLLGPSGCGKTTLLNLVAGFFAADGGEIFIGGQPVTDMPVWDRDIGMMFQNYALFPHMSIARNVGYGLRSRGVPKSEAERRVAEALEMVKLQGMDDRRPRQLSGGQQQRVALARALVIRPKVLLLDEPFSALDRGLRGAMQIELKEIQRRLGITTLFVTHDQDEALSLSDRIAVMSAGRIRQVDTPAAIYRQPADRFVASFVGDVNRLRGQRTGPAAARLGEAQVALPEGNGDGAEVELFFRPEEMAPAEPGQPVALRGLVAAQVYQGDRVELHLDSPASAAGRVVIRSPGHAAMSRWPVGSEVAVTLATDRALAFPRSA